MAATERTANLPATTTPTHYVVYSRREKRKVSEPTAASDITLAKPWLIKLFRREKMRDMFVEELQTSGFFALDFWCVLVRTTYWITFFHDQPRPRP
jgi:hypothetical protein